MDPKFIEEQKHSSCFYARLWRAVFIIPLSLYTSFGYTQSHT